MRALIASNGSYGDILPFLAFARELSRRGLDVHFFANAYFEDAAREAGVPFIGAGSVAEFETLVRNRDVTHARRGFKLIARSFLDWLPEAYRVMEGEVLPGETIVIGSTLAFQTRLIQETRGVPAATVHLAPSIFRSEFEAPRMTPIGIPDWFPRRAKRVLWRIVDRIVDPAFCPAFNRFRAELGLPPVKRIFHEWVHGADLVIGAFPEWFAEPQPDWPKNVALTGFPLFDGVETEMPPGLLEPGAPLVVFTTGTATTGEPGFFREAAEACRLSGSRGIFLTRYPEQLPSPLGTGVEHFDYLPLTQVLARARVLVHHGGIGTSSQALAAGVPQLVRPMAYDQFDNANRLLELGVARILSPRRFRAPAIAAAIDRLARSSSVRNACQEVAEALSGYDAVSAACDVILAKLGA